MCDPEWALCCSGGLWKRPRSVGDTCWEGFSDSTGRGWTLILLPGGSRVGWTTVCIKTRKRNKKQLILLSRWEKKTNPTNQTNPIFLSDCKSVYKCTACGCVRGCVIGNVYQHLNYCREIFQLRALLKAHVSWMDISSLWDSFTVDPGLFHHLLDTLTHFPERPFPVKSP